MSHLLLISDQQIVHESNSLIIFPEVRELKSFACVFTVEQALKEVVVPNVILLEFRLRDDLYGPEYIPQLKERFPDALIVGYSVDPASWTMFEQFGADGFISKTWGYRDVAMEISNFLYKATHPSN